VAGSTLQFVREDILNVPRTYNLSKTLQIIMVQPWATLYEVSIIIAKPPNIIRLGYLSSICPIFAKRTAGKELSQIEGVLNVIL